MTNIVVLPNTGIDIGEPNWGSLIPDGEGIDNAEWRTQAHVEWERIVSELKSRGTLSAGNYNQVLRLVICNLRFARAQTEFWRLGLITKAPKTGVPKVNIYRGELGQAEPDAMKEEME